MGEKKRELVSYVETVDGKVLMTSLATTTFSAKRSKWNTRAWTYQEYILGNRLLVFTDTYIFLNVQRPCSETMQYFLLLGPFHQCQSSRMTSVDFVHPERHFSRYGSKEGVERLLRRLACILPPYRNMKFDSDALPAFSGISESALENVRPVPFWSSEEVF